ncbi:MAG: glycosyltransferase, partial [Planctomycetes bacterium]|nr:glycosyltransferase [Planctomycetota bacterium]
KTSGYDEDILYAEDKDIIYKMEEAAKIRFVDKPLYLCRQLSDSQCHSQAKVAAGILSRAKAKINALKRRCLILEKIDSLNYEKLFRQAIEEAKQSSDIAQYFDVITSVIENGWLKHLKLPPQVTSAPRDEAAMWIAANIESRKILEHIEYYGPAKPCVSVYMVTYNNEKYIRRAIESVLEQTYEKLELIIIDDGSTDNTADIVASYDDKRIRYCRKPHKNFASGMNRAIAEASGEYILGVDSDDYIAPDYIDKMVACVIENPEADYFYPAGFQLVDHDDKPIDRWEYLDFPDSKALPSFLFDNGYSPIPNPGSLKKKTIFKLGMYKEIDTVEDFDFLCKNAFRINFKRVDESSTYFYRRLPSGNTHKFKARNELMARTLNDMVSMYPPEVLCPQLAQVSNIQLKNQQYLRYLMTTFNRLSRGNMVQFPEYYRQYADFYKEKLLSLIARPMKTGDPATAPSDRNHPVIAFKQGLDYLKAARPAQALQCFDSFDRANAGFDNLPFARAIALAQLGKIDQARQACWEQLEIDPDHTDARQFMDRISGGLKAVN